MIVVNVNQSDSKPPLLNTDVLCERDLTFLLAAHLTLFLVPVQKQTCASGSCSGGTVEFTSVKSSLLMIWRERTRPSWSYWCSVKLLFIYTRNTERRREVWPRSTFHIKLSDVLFHMLLKVLAIVSLLLFVSKVFLQQFPWIRPDGVFLFTRFRLKGWRGI